MNTTWIMLFLVFIGFVFGWSCGYLYIPKPIPGYAIAAKIRKFKLGDKESAFMPVEERRIWMNVNRVIEDIAKSFEPQMPKKG